MKTAVSLAILLTLLACIYGPKNPDDVMAVVGMF